MLQHCMDCANVCNTVWILLAGTISVPSVTSSIVVTAGEVTAFAKLRKVTVSFIMSVCPSVRLGRFGSYCTNFHEILCILRKSVHKTPVSLQSANNNRHFTRRPTYIFDHISLSSS